MECIVEPQGRVWHGLAPDDGFDSNPFADLGGKNWQPGPTTAVGTNVAKHVETFGSGGNGPRLLMPPTVHASGHTEYLQQAVDGSLVFYVAKYVLPAVMERRRWSTYVPFGRTPNPRNMTLSYAVGIISAPMDTRSSADRGRKRSLNSCNGGAVDMFLIFLSACTCILPACALRSLGINVMAKKK